MYDWNYRPSHTIFYTIINIIIDGVIFYFDTLFLYIYKFAYISIKFFTQKIFLHIHMYMKY